MLEPHLLGREGAWGGRAKDNRLFINAIFWILRTGAPWRDLPGDYGDWKNTHRRFCRWRDRGIWEALLEQLVVEPYYEWLMIDASHIKVHPHAAGARGGNQDMGITNTKLHLAVDVHGMPLRVLVTSGTVADCTQAGVLIKGLSARHLLADRGYDSDAIVTLAQEQGMKAVLPPRKNRKVARESDILSKMLSCTSSAGEALQRATQRIRPRFSLPPRFDALHSGRQSCDDTV